MAIERERATRVDRQAHRLSATMLNERQDAHGAPTTSPVAALDGINDFVTGFVAYHPRATNVLEVAEQHPDSALANIYAGFLWMFLDRPEAGDKALPWLERARLCRGLNAREQGLLALLAAWQRRDARAALEIAEAVYADHPEDLATLKLGQAHAFNLADPVAALRLADYGAAVNESRAAWHAMHAFGHELVGEVDAAERAAFRALEIDAAEPWAHHALAHTFLERGAIDEGRRFLAERSRTWVGLNSFMFTHNWWHLALFEIAGGDAAAALHVFDERVWGVQPDYSQDQINAVSLLARLECAEIDVGDRWQRLEPYLATRVDDALQPFVTMHYLYGLSRVVSPAAEQLLDFLERQAGNAQIASDAELWRVVGIPCARGVHAHGRGDYENAVHQLAPLTPRIAELGGSKAQRDLFAQLLLDALLKTGRLEQAASLLAKRRLTEPEHPLVARGRMASESLHR